MEEDFFIDEEDTEEYEEDVYCDEYVDEEVNNGGMDSGEAGFLHGYNNAA